MISPYYITIIYGFRSLVKVVIVCPDTICFIINIPWYPMKPPFSDGFPMVFPLKMPVVSTETSAVAKAKSTPRLAARLPAELPSSPPALWRPRPRHLRRYGSSQCFGWIRQKWTVWGLQTRTCYSYSDTGSIYWYIYIYNCFSRCKFVVVIVTIFY